MTEDEAKTKACPPTLGRSPANPEGCIGSACMAWRVAPPAREAIRNYHDGPEVYGEIRGGQRWFRDGWQYQHTDTDRSGRKFDLLHRIPADDAPSSSFCGLAGAPQ